jgi:hypothetical protein
VGPARIVHRHHDNDLSVIVQLVFWLCHFWHRGWSRAAGAGAGGGRRHCPRAASQESFSFCGMISFFFFFFCSLDYSTSLSF